ncbi:hypothetical protein NLX83_32255 [Allokutzneria sp. A3M-2-11 16]|uniref:hypothetical protein n=1 Tax=Allokutzneria sp. A3M-2-11 16 TaxID=2962043 RepID=UPI0020B78EB7|nr:hypothetical protein [Allokutzneria sp. A3M-2-11 16]MCP3803952.1 hypothetical protein [Allokutzneria sp. A3M-2-11 16]
MSHMPVIAALRQVVDDMVRGLRGLSGHQMPIAAISELAIQFEAELAVIEPSLTALAARDPHGPVTDTVALLAKARAALSAETFDAAALHPALLRLRTAARRLEEDLAAPIPVGAHRAS